MIRLISEQYGCRVLGIGDDDQSICSFRSAAPQGIRRFQQDYAAAADYPLSVTLRCGRKIIEWANHVIHQNTDRPANRGDLQPGPNNPEGKVALHSFKTNVQEAKAIAKLIQDLISEGCAPSDVLCLLRGDHNKGFSKPIKEALDALSIPYADPTWVDELLEAPLNRKFLALARLMVDREDSLAWATLLILSNGIGDAFFDKVYKLAREKTWTFARTLLYQAGKTFPEFPRQSAVKASQIIKSILNRLDGTKAPTEAPEGGWAEWLQHLADLPCDIAGTPEFFQLLSQIELSMNIPAPRWTRAGKMFSDDQPAAERVDCTEYARDGLKREGAEPMKAGGQQVEIVGRGRNSFDDPFKAIPDRIQVS